MVVTKRKTVLSSVILGLFVISTLSIFTISSVNGQTTEKVLIYATGSGPVDMDIHNSWDSASGDVLDQVVETLVAYDLSLPNTPLKPVLALNWSWSVDVKNLTMTLRQNVTFHDGSAFNASAVKWNFDRLWNLIDLGESQLGELYEIDGAAIINQTIVESAYQVKFVLNQPYAPFLGLLTFMGSGILAIDSAPADSLLDYGNSTHDIVGTGPFMFENYTTDDNVQLKAYTSYWGGAPMIDRVIFQIFSDANARNQAMLNKEVSFLADPLPDLLDQYNTSADLYLQDGPPSLVIQYIGMNNILINNTIRKASAMAFDYTYALDEVMLGQGQRLRGPIPEGMLHYNSSLDYISQNITAARQVLIDAGLALAGQATNDTYWADRISDNPVAEFNYTYNTDNLKRYEMGLVLVNSLAEIGIKLTLIGTTWADFIYRLYDIIPNGRNMLGYYFVGWGPDFNDPDNYIAPLYSNTSSSNGAQVNDTFIQQKMNEGRLEVNESVRAVIYSDLADYIQNDLVPWIYVYQGYNLDVWLSTLKGYPPNPLGKVYFGDCYFEEVAAAIPIPVSTIITFVIGAAALLVVLESRKIRK
jgi:peptide/nickel transport system substrate-binding protein